MAYPEEQALHDAPNKETTNHPFLNSYHHHPLQYG